MAAGQANRIVHHLRWIAHGCAERAQTDGKLLECFISRQDESAFEELLRRHGPMVLGVCRRLLSNAHDADDAFQATFMVLVRKARSVVPRELVGHWLYGVACRVALHAQAQASRRRAREKPRSAQRSPARARSRAQPASGKIPCAHRPVRPRRPITQGRRPASWRARRHAVEPAGDGTQDAGRSARTPWTARQRRGGRCVPRRSRPGSSAGHIGDFHSQGGCRRHRWTGRRPGPALVPGGGTYGRSDESHAYQQAQDDGGGAPDARHAHDRSGNHETGRRRASPGAGGRADRSAQTAHCCGDRRRSKVRACSGSKRRRTLLPPAIPGRGHNREARQEIRGERSGPSAGLDPFPGDS